MEKYFLGAILCRINYDIMDIIKCETCQNLYVIYSFVLMLNIFLSCIS